MKSVDSFEPKMSPRAFGDMTRADDLTVAVWHIPTERAMHLFEINTVDRIAAFMATATHESSNFTRFEESLYYSRPERIAEVWPSRFHPVGQPQDGLLDPVAYARNPSKLANEVYANRMGNGPAASGDGWRYRGRTIGQVTVLDMYLQVEQRFGWPCVAHPEILLDPEKGALATGHVWDIKNCNDAADARDIPRVRRQWQGGRLGLPEVLALYAGNRRILGATR